MTEISLTGNGVQQLIRAARKARDTAVEDVRRARRQRNEAQEKATEGWEWADILGMALTELVECKKKDRPALKLAASDLLSEYTEARGG